jgi:hypothetical protein
MTDTDMTGLEVRYEWGWRFPDGTVTFIERTSTPHVGDTYVRPPRAEMWGGEAVLVRRTVTTSRWAPP